MQSLQELLGTIKTDHGDRFEDAKQGKAPNSAWDGPALPLTHEYRVTVDTAEYKPSKSTGKNQFVLTYEIQEPTEFAGRKLQAYYSPNPTNEAGSKQLADLFGALKANLDGWGADDFEGFVSQFVGRTAIVTLNTWGEDNDRFGVRWVNADRGQTLRTNIAPQKPKNAGKPLTADIQIPKDEPVQQDQATVSPPVAVPQSAQSALPGTGPNLPPGLR